MADTLLQHGTDVKGNVDQGLELLRWAHIQITHEMQSVQSVMLLHTLAQCVEAYAMALLQTFEMMDYFDL